MKNILVPKYALTIIFMISSSERTFSNLCGLRKLQTGCVMNMTECMYIHVAGLDPFQQWRKSSFDNMGDSWAPARMSLRAW